MVILPCLEWFISNFNYISQLFLIFFIFGLLSLLIKGVSR